MKGIVSFHAIDPRFFEGVIGPLVAGANVNLDAFLESAVRARRNAHQADRWTRALHAILEGARPPSIEPILAKSGSAREVVLSSVGLVRSPRALLDGIKARLDRYDYRLDALSRLVVTKIDPELHLFGRPYFVTEATLKNIADAVDRYRDAPTVLAVDNLVVEQLTLLDAGLARVEVGDAGEPASDFEYRSAAFREVQVLSGLPRAAREGQTWLTPDGARRPALQVLQADLAWTAVNAHARIHPAWIARDVDGIEAMCEFAGLPPTPFSENAERLFPTEVAKLFGDSLTRELSAARDVGAYVPPDRVPDLLEFLTAGGAKILRAASRFGESAAAELVLRKVRECATYAAKHQFGYLEAVGVVPGDKPDLRSDSAI